MVTILEFIGEEEIFAGDDARELLAADDTEALADIAVAIVNGEEPEGFATSPICAIRLRACRS
ncbi:hypothetical protein ACFQGA_08900 [Marinobacter koreensis]|uniref:hypothetical protein n=1 Tax=Marinobacter koreensis TaxID=335974 RepID=UPI003614E034